jgi:hypothetical protein
MEYTVTMGLWQEQVLNPTTSTGFDHGRLGPAVFSEEEFIFLKIMPAWIKNLLFSAFQCSMSQTGAIVHGTMNNIKFLQSFKSPF